MVLMEDGCLSGSPLSVGVGEGWVPGEDSGDVPVEEVWIIDQGLSVDGLIVHDNGSGELQSSAQSLHHEEDDPCVGQPASNVEVLDG